MGFDCELEAPETGNFGVGLETGAAATAGGAWGALAFESAATGTLEVVGGPCTTGTADGASRVSGFELREPGGGSFWVGLELDAEGVSRMSGFRLGLPEPSAA